VDSADNLARLAPVVEEMMDTGMFAVSDVRVVCVQKHIASAGQEAPRIREDLERLEELRGRLSRG
jgi:hypothetical protein